MMFDTTPSPPTPTIRCSIDLSIIFACHVDLHSIIQLKEDRKAFRVLVTYCIGMMPKSWDVRRVTYQRPLAKRNRAVNLKDVP